MGGRVGLVFPKATKFQPKGVTAGKPTAAELSVLRKKLGSQLERYDLTRSYVLSSVREPGVLDAVDIPKTGLKVLLLISPPKTGSVQFSIIQQESSTAAGAAKSRIVGGSTFVVRSKQSR
jgi:hypothetical protein